MCDHEVWIMASSAPETSDMNLLLWFKAGDVKPSFCFKTKESHVQIVKVFLFHQGQIQTTRASLSTQQQGFYCYYSQDLTQLAAVLLTHIANRRRNIIYRRRRQISNVSAIFPITQQQWSNSDKCPHPWKCTFEQEPTSQPSPLAEVHNLLLLWYLMSRQTHNSSKSPHLGL